MDKYYRVEEKEPGHYRLIGPDNVCMDLFIGAQAALLFDTGYGYGNLQEQIKERTSLPLFVVNSHGHLDHTCGNYQFEEKIYIHQKDIELCQEHTGRKQRKVAVENGKCSLNYMTGQNENILPQGFSKESYLNGGSGRLVPTKEGDTFVLGGITLTVYELPGHTKGSIGLYHEEEKILYVGDAMNPFLWLFAPEAETLSVYKESLAKAEAMDIRYFYMSHSEARENKSRLLDFIDAAEHVDYDNGVVFESPLVSGDGARICARQGYGPHDFDKPGFASLVISKEHL